MLQFFFGTFKSSISLILAPTSRFIFLLASSATRKFYLMQRGNNNDALRGIFPLQSHIQIKGLDVIETFLWNSSRS